MEEQPEINEHKDTILLYIRMSWYIRYVASMFVYGTYRGFRADYDNEINKNPPLGTRMLFSCTNGMIYGFTPYGCVKLLHLIDRVDIYMTKNESDYIRLEYYDECLGFAKNMHVL